MIKFDKEWLRDRQTDQSIARYFTAYTAVPWVPYDDSVVTRFKQTLVDESGGVILYDIVDAINTTQGHRVVDVEALTPRSKYNPDMIRRQCKQLEDGGRMGEYDRCLLQRAYDKTRRMFRLSNLKPIPLEEVPYEPSANAGLPTLMKKADAFPISVHSARKIQKGKKPEPAVAFHRGKNDEFARFVLGYPGSMALIEGRFFYPYQAELLTHHTPYAGGRYDFETAGLLNEIKIKSQFIYELDYSQFDSSISALLIKMAFSIIRDSFTLTEDDKKDFDTIVDYFIHTPMLFPDGMIYYGKDHGVPSGSNFTQIIDSIVNCIVIEYVNRRVGLKAIRYLVMGDDVVEGASRGVDLDVLRQAYEEVGIHLNMEKSKVKLARVSTIHFLGHDWSRFIGIRDQQETLERLVTPERTRNEYWSKDKEVRTQAYIERIKSYQDDNMRSFVILQELIDFYRAPTSAKRDWKRYRAFQCGRSYYDGFYLPCYNPNAERTEVRWKHNKAKVSVGKHRGLAAFL